jgi:ribulose-5-phosphate 4-epimerase/fuculose-1-phosphate aldolase
MLISSIPLGQSLSSKFTGNTSSPTPSNTVVLMRRHGFTTWGPDIETAVYRAVFTKTNAGIQANAINLRQSFDTVSGNNMGGVDFELDALTEEQAKGCKAMNEGVQDRPWGMWVQEVEADALYTNNG